MNNVLTEISLLSEKDCFDIVERHKSEFTYPLHRHREYELNFVANGAGVKRIVGDSIEIIDALDLVLICNPSMEHVWEQGECKSKDIREITIQFSPELFSKDIQDKNQFISIKNMIARAKNGISFPTDAILKVYHILDSLSDEHDGFMQFVQILTMMYTLSKTNYKELSSNTTNHREEESTESRRIIKIKDYISNNYTKEIGLDDLSALVEMSPSSLSRFFKLRTHKTITDYITDIRLAHASRDLIDSTKNISEICYSNGFNNLSNFNRTFKSKKGMTPKDYRATYKKNKYIV